MKPIATFSIVAFDPKRREWGVAVQSKFMAAAAVVSWARAGAGAIATQSYCNVAYGIEGLDLLASGQSAAKTVAQLTEADDQREQRQLGIVDKHGQAAAFTGTGCHAWAGHIVGDGFTCQGNILIPGTVEAMATAFEKARTGSGELADWLVVTLVAGQAAGGDKRGRQAAGVLVVRENGGYGGNHDRYLDLRVDDAPKPIEKLGQLVEMHHLFFGVTDPADLIPLADVAGELQELMLKTGHYDGDVNGRFTPQTRTALRAIVGMENLEERWNGEGGMIDQVVVDFLLNRFGQ